MSKQGESITATEPAATTAPPVSEDAPMTDAPANTDPAPPKPNVSEEEAAVLREERRVLMEKGSALHSKWKELSCAFHLPCVEPSLPMAHWDYVLREGKWMAEDFMQERLWKQAAAVKMCLEALKAGGRTRLKPSKHGPTKVTASIEILDSEFGKVRVSPTPAPPAKTGKDGGRVSSRRESREIRQATPPLKDQDKALTSNGREAVDLSLGTLDPLLAEAFCSPSCPPLLLPQKDLPALIARVAQSLEEEDVKRLSRFAVASATYTAAYNSVRWKPLESEEEEAFKARMATGRRVRKGPSLLLDGDHHYEGGELRRSRVVGGGGHGPPRPLDTSKAQGAQAQRKRKAQQRDLQGFVDEDEYPGGGGGGGGGNNNKSRFGSRDDLTGLARSQRAGGGGSGLMRAPRAGGGGMGLPPHGMHPPGMGMAAGNLRGLPSLPPLQRMTAVRSGAVPPTPPAYRLGQAIQPPLGSGERLVQWAPLDDLALASIATEFGFNWSLVADVLRSCNVMHGQFRRHDMCRVRYMALQRALLAEMQGKTDPGEVPDPATMPLNMLQPLLSKPQAKEILSAALPINAEVQRQHMDIISNLALRSRSRRVNERQATREAQRYRPEAHPSHIKAQQGVFQLTGSRVLTPSEINPFDEPPPPAPAPPPPAPPAPPSSQQASQRSSVTLGPGSASGLNPTHNPTAPPPSSSLPPPPPPGGQDQSQLPQGQHDPAPNGPLPSTHPNSQPMPPPPPPLASTTTAAAPASTSQGAAANDAPPSLPPLPPGLSLQQMQMFMSKMQQMNQGGAGAPFALAAAMAQGALQQQGAGGMPQGNPSQQQQQQQPPQGAGGGAKQAGGGTQAAAFQALQAMMQQQQQGQNNQRQQK